MSQVGSGQTMSSSERREAAVTRMLVAVCAVYAVCTVPTVTHAFCRYFLSEFDSRGRLRNTFYATISLTHLMASVNASGNFLIYLTVSTRFKDTLKVMVGAGRAGRVEGGGKATGGATTTRTTIGTALA